eukprot:431047_1
MPSSQSNVHPLNSIHRLLELHQRDSHDRVFGLTWQHIANALSHELYDKLALSFIRIVNGEKRLENANELWAEIKDKTHIQQNEMNYVQQLIDRAKRFHTYIRCGKILK